MKVRYSFFDRSNRYLRALTHEATTDIAIMLAPN